MKRANMRRRLSLEWWCWLLAGLLPLFTLSWLFGDVVANFDALQMPLFIVGLCSMFVSLPRFRAFKHALIATQAALDSPAEADAWQTLGRHRRHALLAASLPAWIAALALFSGLDGVPLIFLGLTTALLCALYRIPPQLG